MRYYGREEEHLVGLTLPELKTLYTGLWNDLKSRGVLGVDEDASDLLLDLQTLLQKEAQREGVDVAHHAEWAEWVGFEGSNCSLPRNEDAGEDKPFE